MPQRYEGWLFVSPLVVGIGVFQAYPLLVSLWSSFTDWDGLSTQQFIGLDNYVNMFSDPALLDSVVTTITFTVVSIPLSVGLALLLALLCNGRDIRGTALFRMAFFTPYVTSIVAISLVFMQFFAPEGLANSVLATFGIEGTDWLTNSNTALWVVILVAVWQGVGYPMVILLAGLQGIPQELYEAAKIDGASSARRLVSITLPLLTPQLFFVPITQFILSFQVFARDLRDDPRRPGHVHQRLHLLPVPERIRVRSARLRVGDGMGDVRIHHRWSRCSSGGCRSAGCSTDEGAAMSTIETLRPEPVRAHAPGPRAFARRRLTRIGRYIVMTAFALAFLLPLLWMLEHLAAAGEPTSRATPSTFMPDHIRSRQNYSDAFSTILPFFVNSVKLAVSTSSAS